jgi:Zn-dependent peptidase ImmA (M78 family)
MFPRGFKSWCENVSAQLRRELNLQLVDPLDPKLLAIYLEVKVWTPREIPGIDVNCIETLLINDPDSWSAVTLCVGGKDLIILNSSHPKSRQTSDLMHELAHLLIGHDPGRVDFTEDGLMMLATYDRKQDEEANWLAGSLLLPRDALLLIRRKNMNLKVAAKMFGVSQKMMQYRLNVTGVELQVRRGQG